MSVICTNSVLYGPHMAPGRSLGVYQTMVGQLVLFRTPNGHVSGSHSSTPTTLHEKVEIQRDQETNASQANTSPDKRSGDFFSTIFFDFLLTAGERKPKFTTEICYGVKQVCFLLIHY